MKPKKYSTLYADLSILILSMPEKEQAKLLDLATRMRKGKNLYANKGRKNLPFNFTSGVLAGWGVVTLLFLVLSAT